MISIGRMQPVENHYSNDFPAWDRGLASDWLSLLATIMLLAAASLNREQGPSCPPRLPATATLESHLN
jgi:hypothetical protein